MKKKSLQFQFLSISGLLGKLPVVQLALGVAFLLSGCGGGGGNSSGAGTGTVPGGGVEAPTFSVSGNLSGLVAGGSLSLSMNGGPPLRLDANGAFSFPQVLQANASYSVTVAVQPAGQICEVSNGSASIGGNVSNVLVSCLTSQPPDTTLTIGGSVSGMAPGTQIGLLNNGAGLIKVNANSSFSFVATSGASYAISIASNPAGQLCTVHNAEGLAKADVSNIGITCSIAELHIVTGSGGGPGHADGIGTNARFNRPQGSAIDSAGNVYVADWNNQIIRKITPEGLVATFAGTYGLIGAADGTGAAAKFCHPLAMVIDKADFLYLTDSCNATIRKISPSGIVSTLAGKAGETGSIDGAGTQARFGMLSGIAIDGNGILYVSDFGNNTIRKVSPAGVVTTLAGSAGVSGYADGASTAAIFFGPNGITVDAQGLAYVSDSYNQVVRRITPGGSVTTLAGTPRTRGSADGQGAGATFSFATPQDTDFGMPPLTGMLVNKAGTLFLTDYFNNSIRTVSPTGLVTTVAGNFLGYLDGQGTAARFRTPTGISMDASGNLYVSEDYNWTVRKISPSMLTSTFAGKPLLRGSRDGAPGVASFDTPYSVAADATGNLYVADYGNNVVRKVSSSGVTTTLAGTPGVIGTADGPGASALFYHPAGIVVDTAGNVYVSDSQANTIRKITPGGVVSTLAGEPLAQSTYADGTGKDAKFSVPGALAIDNAGNLYVADQFNSAVRKVTPSGVVTTIGNGRASTGVSGVAVDSSGNVYFSSSNKGHIKKIAVDGTVTLLAGSTAISSDESGSTDGIGSAARFSFPRNLAVDKRGNVYVADSGNCTVRMVTPIGVVSTIAGVPGQCELHEGPLPGLLPPLLGLTLAPDGQLVITGNNAILRVTGFER